MLAARDLAREEERCNLLVKLGECLSDLAGTANKALDRETALEDLLEVLGARKRLSNHGEQGGVRHTLTMLPSPLLLAALMAPQACRWYEDNYRL